MNCSSRTVGAIWRATALVVWTVGQAGAQIIIDAAIVSTGSRQTLAGSTAGLTVNLPASTWVVGAGWNWGNPFISASWDPPGIPVNVAPLGEEDTALGLSVASAGAYVKPTRLRIQAIVEMNGSKDNVDGVGFWSAMPARANGAPASLDNFTGLLMNEVNGTLQVYAGGALQGSAVSVGTLAEGIAYAIAYEIDTASGGISNVTFDGNAVSGLSTSAFTDAATVFAGVLSGGSSRLTLLDFVVEGLVAPASPRTVITIQ